MWRLPSTWVASALMWASAVGAHEVLMWLEKRASIFDTRARMPDCSAQALAPSCVSAANHSASDLASRQERVDRNRKTGWELEEERRRVRCLSRFVLRRAAGAAANNGRTSSRRRAPRSPRWPRACRGSLRRPTRSGGAPCRPPRHRAAAPAPSTGQSARAACTCHDHVHYSEQILQNWAE